MDKRRRRYTWEEAVERWRAEKPPQPSDYQDDKRIAMLNEYLSGKVLTDITTDLCERIIRDQLKTRKPSTVNRNLVPLRVILRKAERQWRWLERGPYIRSLPEQEGRLRWLRTEEAQRLLNELPSPLDEMAMLGLSTGLRQGNICGLEWEQVDLDRRCLWIHADQSKNRRPIAIPLNDMAFQVIHNRATVKTHPRLVFSRSGQRIATMATKQWRSAVKRAGLQGVTPHTLRHTWASMHIMSGTRVFELMELGGWKSEKMVRRYAHLSADHLLGAAGNIMKIMEKSGAGNEARTRDLNLGKVSTNSK